MNLATSEKVQTKYKISLNHDTLTSQSPSIIIIILTLAAVSATVSVLYSNKLVPANVSINSSRIPSPIVLPLERTVIGRRHVKLDYSKNEINFVKT